jgi:hypothetical protein
MKHTLPALQQLLAAAAAAAAADTGGGDCQSGIDCQLNGLCTNGTCVCDEAWGGHNCSSLNLLSPPDFTPSGFHALQSNWSAWGGGAVYDPTKKRWQGVFHEISGHCGMATWGANGQVRLAHATRPAGPYTVDRLLMPPTATNPSIGRSASGTFMVTHMGIGNGTGGVAGLCASCPKLNGVTPAAPRTIEVAACADNPRGTARRDPALYDVATMPTARGVLFATNFADGPWTSVARTADVNLPNGALFGGRATAGHPEYEGAVFYNDGSGTKINNSRCHDQNAFLVMKMAANISAALAGRWTSLPITYELAGAPASRARPEDICFNWEDNHVYQNVRGEFHAFFHAWRGQPTDYPRPAGFPDYGGCSTNCSNCSPHVYDQHSPGIYCSSLGGHAYSLDGRHWYISPVPIYTPIVKFGDGSELFFRARERPHVVLDEDGNLAALATAVGNPAVPPCVVGMPGCSGGNGGKPGADHTFTLIQPVANARHYPAPQHGGYGGRGYHNLDQPLPLKHDDVRHADSLDTSLATFPAAAYGARWGTRTDAAIANMSKMAMVVLMQEDGACWGRCCKGITGTVVRSASGLDVSGQCGPIHNALAEPGCSPDCDQHGTQLEIFRRMKAAAKAAGRRPPHCVLYVNADYLWPYDTTSAMGDAVRIVDVEGRAHVETCDPGLFPTYLFDYSKEAARQAWLGIVARGLNTSADGVYADCYINNRIKCEPPGSNNCVTSGNGTATHHPMLNNHVTHKTATGWMPGKTRTLRAAAELVASRGGSFYAKNAPLDSVAPFGGNCNWIWLQCCKYMEGKPLMSKRGCQAPGDVPGCVRITPAYLIGQVKEVLKHYTYAVLGTDAVLPTEFMGPHGEYNHSRGLPNSTFVSFCGETGIALFLLAVPQAGGAYLLCQGWDERFGRRLGRPLADAAEDPTTGEWVRRFEHGTVARWRNDSGTVVWAEEEQVVAARKTPVVQQITR